MTRQNVHWEMDGEHSSVSPNGLLLPANRRASTSAPSGAKMLRKKTPERLTPLSPEIFNLSAHPDWPPTKCAATPWELPEDGQLYAPRNTKFCRSFAQVSVFERLALHRQSDDNKNAREISVKSRRGVREKVFLGPNGNVVKKQGGKKGMHGGFSEQAVHHVLASRFRWRHACAEAIAFGKDDVEAAEASISLRAHNTFAVVARAARALSKMRKAVHESAAEAASARLDNFHRAPEKAPTRVAAPSPGACGADSLGPLPPRAGSRSPMLRMGKGASNTALGAGGRTPKDAPPPTLEWRREKSETWTPPAFSGKVSALVAWEKAARARALPAVVKH